MPLRTQNSGTGGARRRLRAALVAAAVVVACAAAGTSNAGVGNYPSPLYLSGGPSTVVTGSFQLLGSAGPGTSTTPSVANGGAGSLTGTYSYIYTVASGGAYSASTLSSSIAVTASQITVGNLPNGTDVAIYREKWLQAAGTNSPYIYVGNSAGATTFTDNNTDAAIASNPVLPEASNRIATAFSSMCAATTCGYLDFSPGVEVAPSSSTNTTPPTLTASPSTSPTSKGWIVDGAGGVTFQSGTWTFSARTKSNNPNGVAHLVVGVWKADSGVAPGSWTTVLDPTSAAAEGSTNIVTAGGNATVSVSVSLPQFALASSEHLYVQFWRRQSTSYSSGAGSNRIAAMLAYDSTAVAQISHPPADDANPNAFSITAPSGATPIKNGVTLQSSASDPSPGSGIASVDYYYCPGFSCTVLTGTAIGSANSAPYSYTWNSQPPDGTYTLIARAADNVGFTTDSSALTVTVDNTPPDTSISSGPPNPSNSSNATFAFSSPDAGATFKCSLDGGAYSTCTSPKSYPGLSDASHTFAVEAVDSAGNVDPSPAQSTWTVDTTPPTMSITAKPSNPSNSSSPSFSFTASESVTGIQCSLDGGAYAACTSPKSYTLADGAHTFAVKAVADTAGNAGSATSYAWTIDTVAPDTTLTAQPADPANSSSASFSFGSPDATATFKCAVDGGAYATCTSPKNYSGLADGSHTFSVEALDSAGNVDPTPASATWTIDTVAPTTTIGAKPADPSNTATPSFAFSANEPVTGFQCSVDGAAFAACSSPKALSLSDGTHTFQVKATADTAGNAGSAASYTWKVDTVAPDTTISSSPASPTASANATFTFTSTETGTFLCSLDGAAYALCASPQTYNGLADGSHTFAVKAVDDAGNVDASPASRTWTVDTTAPDTTIGPTKPASLSTSPNATFDLGATEVGSTFECALDGGVFASCSSPQSYIALADGLHTFQARATDVVGNTDASPAGYSWTIDTTVPTGTPSAPAAGASVGRASQFNAVFTDTTPGDTGTIDFRLCLDPACLFAFASGSSSSVGNGGTASWSYTAYISGLYYWQARAHDLAGNTSAWSSSRQVRIDAFPPGAPTHFTGTVTNGTLVLSWGPPVSDVGSYVVYANGSPWRTVDGGTRSVTIGPFDASDSRRFSVRAIDLSGNVGAESAALVGVPNLVGQTVTQAAATAAARGLLLRNQKLGFGMSAGVVMAQTPTPAAVVTQGATVQVLLAPADTASTPLVQHILPIRLTCTHGSRRLQIQVALSRRASVNWAIRAVRRVAKGTFGSLPAGASRVAIALPRKMRPGRYRLVVTARSQGEQVSSTVKVALTSRLPESASCR